MENPKCSRCNKEWKPNDTDIKKNGEVYKYCMNCREKDKKYYYEKNKEKRIERCRIYREEHKEELKEQKKYYYEKNKEIIAEKVKEYRNNNKEKIKEKAKVYTKNNKEKIAKRDKEYRNNNKEKIKERKKEYYKKTKCEHNKNYGFCKICNLNLYLVNLNRTHIYNCLKSSYINKTKSSIDYLGCDVEYFIDYFKKKMDLWNENNEIKMNWDNIHIDHIKPISVFNLDEEDELNNCCNYTNIQPLLIEDNLNKSNKWTDEDEVYWNENIKGKEYFEIYIVK